MCLCVCVHCLLWFVNGIGLCLPSNGCSASVCLIVVAGIVWWLLFLAVREQSSFVYTGHRREHIIKHTHIHKTVASLPLILGEQNANYYDRDGKSRLHTDVREYWGATGRIQDRDKGSFRLQA